MVAVVDVAGRPLRARTARRTPTPTRDRALRPTDRRAAGGPVQTQLVAGRPPTGMPPLDLLRRRPMREGPGSTRRAARRHRDHRRRSRTSDGPDDGPRRPLIATTPGASTSSPTTPGRGPATSATATTLIDVRRRGLRRGRRRRRRGDRRSRGNGRLGRATSAAEPPGGSGGADRAPRRRRRTRPIGSGRGRASTPPVQLRTGAAAAESRRRQAARRALPDEVDGAARSRDQAFGDDVRSGTPATRSPREEPDGRRGHGRRSRSPNADGDADAGNPDQPGCIVGFARRRPLRLRLRSRTGR